MSQSGRSLRQRAGRGQTLPDFAVGVAVFLLAVTFVFLFIPQLALPFDDQEQPVVAERVTSDLSYNLLADGENRSELNETCTLEFFGENVDECSTLTDDPVTAQLGVAPTYSVNVTLRDAPSDNPSSEPLCRSGDSIEECPGDETLAVGPPIPGGDRSVGTARQRVSVGEHPAVIEVRVW